MTGGLATDGALLAPDMLELWPLVSGVVALAPDCVLLGDGVVFSVALLGG